MLGKFITPDTIIPQPTNPQSFNRYSYTDNNPINYTDPTGHRKFKDFFKSWGSTIISIVGVVLAPFTAGASLYLTYAANIYSGIQAAKAGQFGAWAAGFAVSFALGMAMPVGNFANPLMQVGAGAIRGAAIGALSGGVASVVGGGSFGAGAAQGAIGGAAGGGLSAFATSQQMTNWKNGKGFRSDAANPKITTKISTENISEYSDAKMDSWIEAEKGKTTYKSGDFQHDKAIMSIEKSGENIKIDYMGDNKIDAVLKVDVNNKPTSAIIHIEDMGKNIHWQDLNCDDAIQIDEMVVK